MGQEKFQFNLKLILATLVPIWILIIFVLFTVDVGYTRTLSNVNSPFPERLLVLIVIINVIFLGSGLFLTIIASRESRTKIFETHLIRSLVFREIVIYWKDVSMISIIGQLFIIQTKSQRITLNLIMYCEPEKLVSYIEKRLPQSTERGLGISKSTNY